MTYRPSDADNLSAGQPGTAGSLIVGEGGETSLNLAAYFYDASAASGSRFTVISELTAANTMPKDAGDRICLGVSGRFFWSALMDIGVASSGEAKFVGKYWDGAALATVDLMALKDSDSTHIGDLIFEAVQGEFVTWDRDASTDWATADNQLDEIPNTGVARYWMCFELLGGLTTAVRFDDIKVGGNDFEVLPGGVPHPTYRGRARWVDSIYIPAHMLKVLGTNPTILTELSLSGGVQHIVHNFIGSAIRRLGMAIKIETGMDTSCRVRVFVDARYLAHGSPVDWEYEWILVKQGYVYGGAGSTVIALDHMPSGFGLAEHETEMTVVRADRISLANAKAGDVFHAYQSRRGAPLRSTADVYLAGIRLEIVRYQHGAHT